MTVKSVLDVEIKDENFKRFLELFNKFKAEADKLPQGWAKFGDSIQQSGLKFGDIVAAMTAQAVLLKQMDRDQEINTKSVTKQELSWKHIAGFTKDAASHITSATRSLLKWTSIGGIVSGLAGVGGLFGLERLANNVSTGRRASLGLGTSYGEQKAFGLNFGRFVNPDQFLGGVNQALHDISQRYSLLSVGVPGSLLQTNNAAAVGSDLLLRLKDLADQTNPAIYQQAIQARGLGGVVSVADLERLHGMSRTEVLAQQARYKTDAAQLGLTGGTQERWQNFNTQLQRAGEKIENVLVKGLDRFTGPLSRLSDAVANSLGTIIASIKPSDMDAIAKGIDNFATYIASPRFRTDLKTFVDDVEYAAHKTVDALRWLGLLPSAPPANVSNLIPGGSKLPQAPISKTFIKPGQGAVGGTLTGLGDILNALSFGGGKVSLSQGGPMIDQGDHAAHLVTNADSRSIRLKAIAAIERANHLPKGLLATVYGNESNFGSFDPRYPWWKQNKAGALGPFQLMARTAGGIDRNDFAQSSVKAGSELSRLYGTYHGDVAKTLAAYDWGQGNLNKDIKAHGADWMSYLPKETADYLRKAGVAVSTIATAQVQTAKSIDKLANAVKKGMSPSKTTVTLSTNPGSSSVVIANQAAVQN